MKAYTLALNGNPSTLALIAGIAIANSTSEREGIALGVRSRANPDFTVRFGSDANAPVMEDARVTDCWPLTGSKVTGNRDNLLWLERTPVSEVEANKSLVLIEGFEGYTLIQGSPKPLAAGPGTMIVRMKPSSAINFITPSGQKYVLYTNNDARQPQVIAAEKFDVSFLTQGVAPASTVRDEVPSGSR